MNLNTVLHNIAWNILLIVLLSMQANSTIAMTFSQNLIAEGVMNKNEKSIVKSKSSLQRDTQVKIADTKIAIGENIEKTLVLDITELTDNQGLVYLAGQVSKMELNNYLAQLKAQLGEEEYALYRQHQAKRDHHDFHVTLVNPYEYKNINKEKLNIKKKFHVTLHGLGKASRGNTSTYFVVASSPEGQLIRKDFLLKNKDFHITLGFNPTDVFNVSKGTDTLIKK